MNEHRIIHNQKMSLRMIVKELKSAFIGMELDPKYFKVAKQRISEAQPLLV